MYDASLTHSTAYLACRAVSRPRSRAEARCVFGRSVHRSYTAFFTVDDRDDARAALPFGLLGARHGGMLVIIEMAGRPWWFRAVRRGEHMCGRGVMIDFRCGRGRRLPAYCTRYTTHLTTRRTTVPSDVLRTQCTYTDEMT